jgi:Fe2+ or Zn2+ uptake regulation protein
LKNRFNFTRTARPSGCSRDWPKPAAPTPAPGERLARGRAIHPRLAPVSVYRTLDLLRSLGLVERLHHPDGCSSFMPASEEHGHHVTCERCRRTVEFSGCEIEKLARSARAQTGFTVHSHWLELTGICPECRRAGAARGGSP